MLPCEEWGMHGFPTRPGIGWIGDSRLWTLDVGGLGSRVFLQGAEPAPIATTAEPSGIARNFPGNNRSWISFEIGPESPEDHNIVRWEVQDVDVQIPLKTDDGSRSPSIPRTAPHILWVVADDLGWADVSWRSEGQTLTPTLDALRRGGVELTNMQFYKFCTPTRSSFMSGRIPFHTLQHLVGYGSPTQPSCAGLQLNYTLLPELLRERGYHCAHVGKCEAKRPGCVASAQLYRTLLRTGHLGAWADSYLPTARGFHESLAYLCLTGRYDHFTQEGQLYCPGAVDLWLNDGPARGYNGTFDAEMYSRFAVDVIRRHAQRAAEDAEESSASPLYLHLEYHVVHEPVQSPQHYQDRYPHVANACRKAYCGMLSALDDGVANVTQALRVAGMYEQTVTVVSTDNGGLVSGSGGCGSNFPLRGGKHSFFAGGIQGTALVHSPLLPPSVAGTVYGGLSHAADFYPSLAKLAGITDLSSRNTGPFPVDGVDLWPFLTRQRSGNAHGELLISGCRTGSACNGAMFVGELKLIVGKQAPSGWYEAPSADHADHRAYAANDDCSAGPCVFNMTSDPTEKNNLAAADPGRFAALVRRFEQLSKVAVPQDRGSLECSVEAVCAQANRNGGFLGPWGNTPSGNDTSNRSCACPPEREVHFGESSSTTIASFAGGDADMCRQRCCSNVVCDGWVFQSFQIESSGECARGKPCCYLHHGRLTMEPKENCSAGLMGCTNQSILPLKSTDGDARHRVRGHHSSWQQRAVARGRSGRSKRLRSASPTPPPPSRDSINALDYVR